VTQFKPCEQCRKYKQGCTKPKREVKWGYRLKHLNTVETASTPSAKTPKAKRSKPTSDGDSDSQAEVQLRSRKWVRAKLAQPGNDGGVATDGGTGIPPAPMLSGRSLKPALKKKAPVTQGELSFLPHSHFILILHVAHSESAIGELAPVSPSQAAASPTVDSSVTDNLQEALNGINLLRLELRQSRMREEALTTRLAAVEQLLLVVTATMASVKSIRQFMLQEHGNLPSPLLQAVGARRSRPPSAVSSSVVSPKAPSPLGLFSDSNLPAMEPRAEDGAGSSPISGDDDVADSVQSPALIVEQQMVSVPGPSEASISGQNIPVPPPPPPSFPLSSAFHFSFGTAQLVAGRGLPLIGWGFGAEKPPPADPKGKDPESK
jgi:hypothetical protein